MYKDLSELIGCIYFRYLTGSYPLLPHGWQDKKRLNAISPPFHGPCFLMASIP